jgi:large subunit ribosomal protein LP0|tara:strand:+ start:107 stop:877 length:771 start_codon:yes stop_codon:yes gene_type:complete
MGKNTMMRKCMRDYAERTGSNVWDVMAEQLVGNVGIVFTTGELVDVRAKIAEHVVPAPARMNAVAPLDVIIPAGPTGMEPSQTGFFQVLNIATKINKGSIEILSEVVVVREGEKVTSSAATLLAKMGFTPFFYGLETKMVYDKGNMYDVAVLDISDADISAMFGNGLANVAALSLAANYPTVAAVPHSLVNGYKNILALTLVTDYTFPLAEKAMAAAAAAPAGGGGGGGGGAAAAAKAPEPEEEEEEEGGDFDLFD